MPGSIESFPPLIGVAPHTLILGSMPGRASLDATQYYAHPRNAFWPIVAELLDFDPDLPYPARCACLTDRGFALWDVLRRCERQGSLDTAIKTATEVANDLGGLLTGQPSIGRVFFNGAKAETAFRRHVLPALSEPPSIQRLPSTSPAHASLRFSQKLKAWRVLVD